MKLHHLIASTLLIVTSACTTEGTSTTKGSASQVKPESDGGQKVPKQENDDDFKLTISIVGEGTFDAVDALLCQLTSGEVTTSVESTGNVGDDGAYESSFQTSAASSGANNPLCGELKNLKLTAVTAITISGSIPTNDANCTSFCQAKADEECSGDADEAQCTSDTNASCKTTCSSGSEIKGTGTASASAVADADSSAKNTGDVNTTIDLVFTDIE